MAYHDKTIELLRLVARSASKARLELDEVERAITQKLPTSVREWYEMEGAVEIMAEYSNADHPVPVDRIGQSIVEVETDLGKQKFLVFKRENQGVCKWAVLLDGGADPPVFLDFDTGFNSPVKCTDSFSEYLYSCTWDYSQVLASDSLLIQAQNAPLSKAALEFLSAHFDEESVTYGWPGERQYRFAKRDQRVLIWANRAQADW